MPVVTSALNKDRKEAWRKHEVLIFYVSLSWKASQRRCHLSRNLEKVREGVTDLEKMVQMEPAREGPEMGAVLCSRSSREANGGGIGAEGTRRSRVADGHAPTFGALQATGGQDKHVLAHMRACDHPRRRHGPLESPIN